MSIEKPQLKIRVLPRNLVEQIAAGEVVERPASVVKELLENALDSLAKRIGVSIESGGTQKIEVTDDGTGMLPADADLCYKMHATSKLADTDPLENINSFGFRGEALASICAISKCEIVTRHESEQQGVLLKLEGGNLIESMPAGAPVGTRITVNDLFYNTPARKKFLKTERTEAGHISSIIEKLAMAHPQVAFRYQSGSKKIYDLPPEKRVVDRIVSLWGEDCRDLIYPIEREAGPYSIFGMVGSPDYLAPNTRGIYLFVNRRPVVDAVLRYALIDAFRRYSPSGSFPRAAIFIDLPSDMVDVNVHPTKQEVRFREERSLRSLLYNTVEQMLSAAPWLGVDAGGYRHRISEALQRFSQKEAGSHNYNAGADYSSKGSRYPAGPDTAPFNGYRPSQEQKTISSSGRGGFYESLKIIGQARDSYIICQSPQGLVIIDQHAAAERISFEKLKNTAQLKSEPGQPLLVPITIDLPAPDAGLFAQSLPFLKKAGLVIELFGDRSFIVKELPAFLTGANIEELVNDISGELTEYGSVSKLQERFEDVLATIACHNSLRANRKLTTQEMQQLLTDLHNTSSSTTCPHGRPVYKHITYEEMEKLFKRS